MKQRFLNLSLILVFLAASVTGARAQDGAPIAPQAVGTGTAFLYRGTLSRGGTGYTGICAMTFRLWDAATAGAPASAELSTSGVVVQAGTFETVLDFGETSFTSPSRWLEIGVQCDGDGAPTTLTPRQALWPVPYAIYAGSTAWSGITGMPAGFADGVDNNNVYTAGDGLALNGNQFSVAASIARVSDIAPTVAAAGFITRTLADSLYLYTAGDGLTLTGNTFNVDSSVVRTGDLAGSGYITKTLADTLYLNYSAVTDTVSAAGFITKTLADATYQARVTGTCTAGQKITAIAADGSVTCANDPAYTAGSGLTLAGNTFSVVTSTVQARVTGACAVGQYVRSVNADGTVVCGTDANNTYAAGAGLTLTGNTFNTDTTVMQARVTGTCTAGQKITAIAANGTVTCGTDADTTYSAGSGLSLAGTTFSANTGVVQARVTGTCAVGQYVRVVNADGSVTCGTDADTTYTAGSGLTLTGNQFSANTGVVQARVAGTCATGSYVRAVNADGSVTCENGYLSGMAAKTYLSAAIANSNVCSTLTRIPFNIEDFDTGGIQNNGRMYATVTGIYQLAYEVSLTKSGGDSDGNVQMVRSDGAGYAGSGTWLSGYGGNTLRATALVRMTAGQWMDVLYWGGNGGGSCVADVGVGGGNFSMYWVAP